MPKDPSKLVTANPQYSMSSFDGLLYLNLYMTPHKALPNGILMHVMGEPVWSAYGKYYIKGGFCLN